MARHSSCLCFQVRQLAADWVKDGSSPTYCALSRSRAAQLSERQFITAVMAKLA